MTTLIVVRCIAALATLGVGLTLVFYGCRIGDTTSIVVGAPLVFVALFWMPSYAIEKIADEEAGEN